MKDVSLKKEATGVFRVVDSIPFIDSKIANILEGEANLAPLQRSRICIHEGDNSPVHEMFILLKNGGYVRPHKHLKKSESQYIMSGKVTLILFEESGSIKQRISLGDFSSNSPFYYRMPPGQYHSILVESEQVLIHEVIAGPIDSSDTVFAPWAPSSNENNIGLAFLEKINTR